MTTEQHFQRRRCRVCGRFMQRVPWFDGIAQRFFYACSRCGMATNA